MNVKTARLWVFAKKGLVRIGLEDGQRLRWSHGYEHEEGWSRESRVWYREGDFVFEKAIFSGLDCDGKHWQIDEYECRIADIDSLPSTDDGGVMLPDWKRVGGEVYDQFARAAGY